jgi:hypothetical protein
MPKRLFSGLFVIIFSMTLLASGCTSQDKLQLLTDEKDAVQTQLQLSQSQYQQTSTQLAAVQAELATAQADRAALKTANDAAVKKIAELEAKASPRNFKDSVELANWLALDPVSELPDAQTYPDWYAKALALQKNAARDGFIVSVQYHFCDERQIIEYIACLTQVNGYLFMWDPETDEVEKDPLWGKIE